MKFLIKDNVFHYLFLFILIFSGLYRLSYSIMPLFYILSFIFIVFLSLFLNVFIKNISNKEDLKKLENNKKSCIQLGICFTFLSLYPVLHFYAVNHASFEIYFLFTNMIIVLFGILSFILIYFFILKNFWVSFYMSSFLGIAFYFINLKNIDNLSIFLLIALIIYASYFLFKKGTLQPFKNIIITVAIVLGIFICFDFLNIALRTWGGVYNNFKNSAFHDFKTELQTKEMTKSKVQNDIYIIMLDMYPGEKSLEKLFGYDNSNFTNELQKRGFYVFKNIYANYNLTAMALPTMLNMDYVENTIYKDRFNAINDAKIFKLAKTSGRKTIYINHSSFFRLINPPSIKLIDISNEEYDYALNKVYNDSIIYIQYKNLFRNDKEKHVNPFNILKKVSEDNDRKFIFAHFEMPHNPYLFNEYGNLQTNPELLHDKIVNSKLILNKEGFITYLKFTNKEVLNFIDYIFENSDQKPIILINGDHGIRTNDYVEDWNKHIDETLVDKTTMHARFNTFAAYYNPNGNKKEIQKANSIVNLYRLFSNDIFNTNYNILNDKHTMFFCAIGCENYNLFKNAAVFTNKEFKQKFEL